jgi:hypothetical protein
MGVDKDDAVLISTVDIWHSNSALLFLWLLRDIGAFVSNCWYLLDFVLIYDTV